MDKTQQALREALGLVAVDDRIPTDLYSQLDSIITDIRIHIKELPDNTQDTMREEANKYYEGSRWK